VDSVTRHNEISIEDSMTILLSTFLSFESRIILRGDFMHSYHSILAGTSRKMKIRSVLLIVTIVIAGISLIYFLRPQLTITNEPVIAVFPFDDQHVVIYSVDVSGENVTVGEIGLTWKINLVSNTSEYDYYEFFLFENVRGSAADIGEVGWIEGGQTLIDLRSDNLMVEDSSEEHGNGAVQVTTTIDALWNGSIEWRFGVLLGSDTFHPREASNGIHFTISIRAIHGADVNFTLYGFSYWSIYGYSFDRILVRATEIIVFDIPSQI